MHASLAHRWSRAIGLLLLALAAACSSEPTEVMLVVDGEFATPTEVDNLAVTLTAPSGATTSATATFDASSPGFPRTLGMLRGQGGDGDYVVEVVARKGASTVVSRRARFRFTSGQVRMLRIDLLRVCASVSCPSLERTCGDTGICVRIEASTDPWSGTPPSQFDAGVGIQPLLAP